MAFAKVLAVLCTLLIVQAQAGVPHTEQQQLTDTIIDTLINIINGTEETILEGLKIVKSTAQDSEKNLEHARIVIVSKTTNLLNNLKDDLNKELDKLKNKTTDAGKKLINCVESEGNDTVSLAVRLLNNTLNCVNVNVDKVVQIIPPWIGKIEVAVRTVQNTTNGLAGCRELHLLEKVRCVRQVVAQASHDLQPINGIINEGIEAINKAAEEYLGKQVGPCVKEQGQRAREEALDAFSKVATCATS